MSFAPRVPVSFLYRGAPGARVELVGDFPDWRKPVALEEREPGVHRCALELLPGLYRYRFRLPRSVYVDDPAARVFDYAEGYPNAVLVVGGALPPLHFAPDRQHLSRLEDGRILVHGEVDEGVPIPPSVWLARADGVRHCAPTRLSFERGGRQGFTASLEGVPAQAEGSLGFETHPAHVFPLPPARSASGAPPRWLSGAVLYAIFLDRWHRGRSSPPDARARGRSFASHRDTCYGGDLDGVTESLGELQSLGADAVVLTPVHPSPTPHRYDSVDLLAVDPALGGVGALGRLVAAAHGRGMKLVLDLSVTHVHDLHPAFRDVLEHQESSAYASWFQLRRFPVVVRDNHTYRHYYQRAELPLLNLEPGPARAHAIEAALRLVRLGVDGLRLDAMDDAPGSFWRELRAAVRAENSELLLLGEVVGDRPARHAEEAGVDCATDFGHREEMLRFFAHSSLGAGEFWSRAAFAEHRAGPFAPCFRLHFLDNHDTGRFLSAADGSVARLHVALAYLLFRPEPAWLTYGTEAHLTAGRELDLSLDDAWPERLPMPAPDSDPTRRAPETLSTRLLLSQLSRLRRELASELPARLFEARGHLLVLEREARDGRVMRAHFNSGELPNHVAWPEGAERVLAVGASPSPGAPLPPFSALFLRLPPR